MRLHISKRQRRITGTGGKDKHCRNGNVGARRTGSQGHCFKPQEADLKAEVKKHIEAGSTLYTDALMSYRGQTGEYAPQVVDHAVEYANGRVHTNGLENFWPLLKRGIYGTHISVDPFHLRRYLDEQAFTFNNRKILTMRDDLTAS
jgi:transposase-like protein